MADFIDLSSENVDDIPEGEILPDGTELEARITRIASGEDKNGTPYIMPWFEDPGNVNVEDFNDYLPLPVQGDTDKERGRKLRDLKAFATSFGLDLFRPEYPLDEAKGALGWMIVGIGKDRDGKNCNKRKKYLVQS